MKKSKSKAEKFNNWMRKKVKSVFYHDNEKMCNAYQRIYDYERNIPNQ